MKCDKFQTYLPDLLLDPARAAAAPVELRQHLAECSRCEREFSELRATVQLMDTWQVPEPSVYFDTRMAARLREEKKAAPAGWLERMRSRMVFGESLNLRPAMAAAFALLLVVGAGSYEGYVHVNSAPPARQTTSATVNDLELLDRNAQTLQEMAAFDSTDATVGQNSTSSGSNE
jgi:transcription elongation GreA/GreB family factor